MTRPVSFRQAELKKALLTFKEAGVHIEGARFPPEGGFVLLTATPPPEQPADEFAAWEQAQGGHRAA